MSFDGLFRYGYDAWNRQAKVSNAYRQSGRVKEGSAISASPYDGLGCSKEEGWPEMRRRMTIVVVSVLMLLGCLSREASAMLHTAQGRFLQRDPLGYADGMSVYQYVRSRPIRAVDPYGLAEADCKACNDCEGKNDIADEIDAKVKALVAKGVEEVYRTLGANKKRLGIPMTVIEDWADGHSQAAEPDPGKTKYRGTQLVRFLNKCVLVCKKCVGSDKLGHMFQQGYEYYNIADAYGDEMASLYGRWTEGVGTESDYPERIRQAAKEGKIVGFGGYGRNASGVISYADLAANSAGFRMYRDIAAGKFRTICDYVTENMSEERNPNEYDTKHPALRGWTPPKISSTQQH